MKPAYGLELIQTQKLVLTPELHQAIMILQMNVQELSALLLEEVETNPLLELAGHIAEKSYDDSPGDEEDWIAYFFDSSDLGLGGREARRSSGGLSDEWRPLDYAPVQPNTSIRGHLLSQLGVLHLTEKEQAIACFIIESIDDNGYLQATTEEIASATASTPEQVEAVLELIQRFDPPGVAARNLRECLKLQAEARGLGELVLQIIQHHLDDLAKGRYTKISQSTGTSLQQVLRARDAILGLEPKPGAAFSGGHVTFIVPDVAVRRLGDEFVVILNDSALLAIRWNPYYRKLLAAGEQDARNYLIKQMRRARFLLRSIEQRRLTISRVMEAIVERQRRFFMEGPGHLEPMTLKDIASRLDMHDSTVSRAVAGKYVDTPFGVFPCKMFFTPGVESRGQEVSQYNLKKLIEQMVRSEDPGNPLTDSQIAHALNRRGIDIARRTVAKYRSQLGIPPSNRRKKL
ncbi:MAG TPA: RNA polymerase sigma-54 factor [Clostridiales bacterium UBA9857]|jgi:RNA polymerase sigma-54 factor|nr:RNA polymerase sigma-54 factor [Clostridiales bacterium UBA9857]